MMEQCKAQHAPEPEFVLIRNKEFRTIMPRDYLTEQVLNRMELNERQIKAVKLIKEKGPIGLSDLKEFYPTIADRTLNRDFQALVDKDILKAKGERKDAGMAYKISDIYRTYRTFIGELRDYCEIK